MENKNTLRAEQATEGEGVGQETPESEKIFRFHPRVEPAAADASPVADRRDWAAAIELIHEASEAVRLAQERAVEAEDYAKQLASYHKEQMKAAEARVASAEKRAETALLRATEAESWLVRFHDAIIDGFGSKLTG